MDSMSRKSLWAPKSHMFQGKGGSQVQHGPGQLGLIVSWSWSRFRSATAQPHMFVRHLCKLFGKFACPYSPYCCHAFFVHGKDWEASRSCGNALGKSSQPLSGRSAWAVALQNWSSAHISLKVLYQRFLRDVCWRFKSAWKLPKRKQASPSPTFKQT